MSERNAVALFGAVEDGNLNGFGDTFGWIAYTLYDGENEIGYCNLMPNGDVNDGTQEGCLDGEYTVDLFPDDIEMTYHNNEDGSTFTYDEFMKNFNNNEKWKLVNLYGELETV